MANWIADFLAANSGAQIVGRARNALHVRAGSNILAHFLGSPIHYWDAIDGWLPIETDLVDLAGIYSFKGCPVTVTPDGLVTLVGTNYWQQTDNIGIFNQAKRNYTPLLTLPNGTRDGNSLVRDVPTWGTHRLYLTPRGLREEITMLRAPAGGTNDWLVIRSAIGGKTWGEGFIPDEFYYDSKRFSPVPVGEDANGRAIPVRRYARIVGSIQYLYTGIKISDLQAATFPIVFDPDFVTGSGDGRIQGDNATYATARSTAAGINMTATTRPYGQQNTVGTFLVNRLFLLFDTSSIGAGSTVTAVTLTMTATALSIGGGDFDLLIMKQDWSAQDPITTGNMEAAYDNCLAGTQDDNKWATASVPTLNTPYASAALNTAYVNKIGTTYYSCLSSLDLANSPPATDTAQVITLAQQEHTTPSYRPTLNVTYTAEGAAAQRVPYDIFRPMNPLIAM